MSDTVTLSCDDALTLATAAAIGAGAIPPAAAAIARAAVARRSRRPANRRPCASRRLLEALAAGRIDGQAEPEITRPAPGDLSCPMPAAAPRIRASIARSTISPRRPEPSAWRCSRKGTPTPAARSAISPAGWPNAAWWRSPPPTGRRCSPARARPSRSTAPTRCPSLRRSATGRRWSSTSPRAPPLSSTSARRGRRTGAIPAGWALDAKRPADHRCRSRRQRRAAGIRRRARRQHRADGRGAGGRADRRQLVARCAQPSPADRRAPAAGLFVLALEPRLFSPKFTVRLAQQLGRLANDYGVHIPGRRRAAAGPVQEISLPAEIHRQIAAWAARAGAGKSG